MFTIRNFTIIGIRWTLGLAFVLFEGLSLQFCVEITFTFMGTDHLLLLVRRLSLPWFASH